jgi:pimeloyl-ACP methyl ester carboxylesterase
MSRFSRVRRTPSGDYEIELEEWERGLLRELPERLRELLAADDPVLERLFPPAYTTDEEKNAEYTRLMRADLTERRLSSLDVMEATVDEEVLTEEQVSSWMGSLNDLRLVLGAQLDVTEDMDEIEPGDPRAPAFALYGYLSVLQESVIAALSTVGVVVKDARIAVGGGIELNVRVWEGDGVPFLLVHGLASNARLWDGVANELAAAGHAVAAVDLRGHGRSDKPDAGYDFATVSADLVEVIGALDYDRPVVAGQSWGGNVVLELGARRPELVRGVACIDGGWIDLSRFATWEECEAAMAPPRTTGLQRAEIESMLRGRHPDWPDSGIDGALSCFETRDDGTVAPWLTYERHLMILRELWAHRVVDVYRSVEAPTLLLPCDDGSPWTDRKRSDVAAAQAGLRISRTQWFLADHDVHAQYPEDVAGALLDALDEGFFV